MPNEIQGEGLYKLKMCTITGRANYPKKTFQHVCHDLDIRFERMKKKQGRFDYIFFKYAP